MKTRRGYSLIEIGIAVCVIAVGVLGTLAAFSFALRSVDHARNISVALNVGRQIVEQIRAYNIPDWSKTWPVGPPEGAGLFDRQDDRIPINAQPFEGVAPNENLTRNVILQRLGTDPADYHYNMALIIVTVYWKENGVEKNVVLRSVYKQP